MATITEIFKAQKARVGRSKKQSQTPVVKGRLVFRNKFNTFSPFLFMHCMPDFLLCYVCYHNVLKCRVCAYSYAVYCMVSHKDIQNHITVNHTEL